MTIRITSSTRVKPERVEFMSTTRGDEKGKVGRWLLHWEVRASGPDHPPAALIIAASRRRSAAASANHLVQATSPGALDVTGVAGLAAVPT